MTSVPLQLLKLMLVILVCSSSSSLYSQNCTPNENLLSNELWPLKLTSISNTPFVNSGSSKKVPALYAAKVMASSNLKAAPEMLVFEKDLNSNLDKEFFWKEFYAELERKKIPKEDQKILSSKIKFIPSFGSTWQRDHSVFTFQKSTKEISMNNFLEMKTEGEDFQKTTNLIARREMISAKVVNGKNENGNAGGNFLGIPGNLCLTGNNIDNKAAEKFCPEKNRVQIETHWLFTGHVDEFIKFVPDLTDMSSPPECRFKILANSPRKAFELLKQEPTNSFRESILTGSEKVSELDSIFREACILMDSSGFQFNEKVPSVKKIQKAIQALINTFQPYNTVWAQDDGRWILDMDKETEKIMKRCLENKEKITNRNVVSALEKNKDVVLANKVIEESIERSLKTILSSIKSRLPNCNFDHKVIPVPQIYSGAELYKENGIYKLSDPGSSTTIFPNITNSVTSNKTLIISDVRNSVLKKYIDKTVGSLGLKADYIDTLFFSDLGNGNIHCATSSVHLCE